MNPCFAIIDSNTLESTALKDILWELFNHVEVYMYNDIDTFIRDSNRHFVHFFVGAEMLFSNSEEFEPLKYLTTVLTNGANRHLESSGFRTLDTSSTEENIVANLTELQRLGHYGPARIIQDEEVIKLSDREKEVLRFIVKGLSNKEIAQELNISLPTAIFHRNNICDKLQTRSVGKLTIFSVLSGIIDIKEI